MRKILLNTWVLLSISVFVVGASFIYSLLSCDFTWFARSGSVMAILGLILTIKHSSLSEEQNIDKVMMQRENFAVCMPNQGSEEYNSLYEKYKRYLRDENIGLLLTILGTIIWGYGDAFI